MVSAGRTYDTGGGNGLEYVGHVHTEDLVGNIQVLE